MSDIKNNLRNIKDKIQKQAEKFNLNANEINLIAVSKKQPPERVQAMLDCGHRLYGENRVQEAQERWSDLKKNYPDLMLHLIGPLQTNKIKDAVQLFDVIETIDRPKLIDGLVKETKSQNKALHYFIQVNTGEEKQKAGVFPKDLKSLLEYANKVGLKISGLMCIPPQDEPASLHFAYLQKLAQQNGLKDLSMGMSDDFEKAIALGATYVRVGSALFGER
jgi:pyridoxal phosphate enzyme (YggS family)